MDPTANQHDEKMLHGYSTAKAEPEDVYLDPQTAPTSKTEEKRRKRVVLFRVRVNEKEKKEEEEKVAPSHDFLFFC